MPHGLASGALLCSMMRSRTGSAAAFGFSASGYRPKGFAPWLQPVFDRARQVDEPALVVHEQTVIMDLPSVLQGVAEAQAGEEGLGGRHVVAGHDCGSLPVTGHHVHRRHSAASSAGAAA